jgi:hypothetical protein
VLRVVNCRTLTCGNSPKRWLAAFSTRLSAHARRLRADELLRCAVAAPAIRIESPAPVVAQLPTHTPRCDPLPVIRYRSCESRTSL